jgi:co-chaperonin GroES (HSP10)
MRLEPLLDCVVIDLVKTVNGLHLPDTADGGGLHRGVIVAVGESVRKLKVGDEVFYSVRARGATAELVHFEGKDFVVCPAEAVVARVRPDEPSWHDPQTCPGCIKDGSAEAERRVMSESKECGTCGCLWGTHGCTPSRCAWKGGRHARESAECSVCKARIYAGDLVSNVGTLAHSKCRPDFIEREFKP